MINQPSPEVQQRLRAMCAQMAVAQRLNDEIQRELYGHMEDKLLAYLNGEEGVTEEDALILVREHFGDPAIVKGLLQSVHPAAARNHFLRRGVAVLCASTVLMFLTGIASTAVLVFVQVFARPQAGILSLYSSLSALVRLLEIVLLCLTLQFWQRRIDNGHSVWFQDWSGWVVACIGGAVCAAGFAVLPAPASGLIMMVSSPSLTSNPYVFLLATVYIVSTGLVWIWWCDRPPRLSASILAACGLWGAFQFMMMLSPCTLMMRVLTSNNAAPADYLNFFISILSIIPSGAGIICASGLWSMAIYAALRGVARRRTEIA